MNFYGAFSEVEATTDLLVRKTLGDQRCDFLLTHRQGVVAVFSLQPIHVGLLLRHARLGMPSRLPTGSSYPLAGRIDERFKAIRRRQAGSRGLARSNRLSVRRSVSGFSRTSKICAARERPWDGRLSPQFCIEQAVSAARDLSATLDWPDVLGGDNSPSSVPLVAIFFPWSGARAEYGAHLALGSV